MDALPEVARLTSAPLRNRLRVELHAPPMAVWVLVGDVRRLPEFTGGIARVDAELDAVGSFAEYTCHFRPMPGESTGITHREVARWFVPGVGYATSADPANSWGLRDDLNLLTVEPTTNGTLFTWDEYFDSPDVAFAQASYDAAFKDIGERLVHQFGGRVVERFARPTEEPTGALHAVGRLADAMHRNDLVAAQALYAPVATLVLSPQGAVSDAATGGPTLAEALRTFVDLRPTLVTDAVTLIEAGDLGLYLGRWRLTGVGPSGEVVTMGGESADVLRRDDAGIWRIAIDNPWGAAVLAARGATTP